MTLNGKFKAFTLAEVLITLLIIGVVASLIVPNLINDAQDAEFKVAWKKAYAEIDLATRRIMQDNGGTFLYASNNGATVGRNNEIINLFCNYLSCQKRCNSTQGLNNCFVFAWDNESDSALITSNGTVISFRYLYSACTGDGRGQWCSLVMTDVNGSKTPNEWGRDVFGMFILKDGLVPMGSYRLRGDMGRITCTDSAPDWTCSAKYLFQ